MPHAPLFPRRSPESLTAIAHASPDQATIDVAQDAIDRVAREGERAVDELSLHFAERAPNAPLFHDAEALQTALNGLDAGDRIRLERIAERIAKFADAQRSAVSDIDVAVDGGRAGHVVSPVAAAGCYAPGGRYPLPSSVLMTAVTARRAGVGSVWVASPKPTSLTLAAAAVAGADGLLSAGGAHAVAALAHGVGPIPRSDVVVGPGNRFVTAAKRLLFGRVQIDMLAGPSELTVLADATAHAATIAADLLAQAEHDTEACPILVTPSEELTETVAAELARQLDTLPTAAVARAALARGGVAVVESVAEGIRLCNALSPEHLEVMVADPGAARAGLTSYGAVFYGAGSAEVFGDYGIGPNHVLPTGGTAHAFGGLSVMTFLTLRTWLEMDAAPPPAVVTDDVTWLARAEGLEAHARAAEARASPES